MSLLTKKIIVLFLLITIGKNKDFLLSQSLTSKTDISHFAKMKWRNIGPNRGGRSLGSTGSPGRPLEYYFGATGGGLWKTTDGGQEWFPVTDGQINTSSVGAVAVAETNPDIVYIGMGETQLRGSITQGDGVYKSEDGGKKWRHLGLKETQSISRIRIHPTNPDIVFVAALGHPYGDNEERGVFRSKDGGNTWQKVLYVGANTGAADLIIDKTNPKILYATTWQVYRKTWKMWGGGEGCRLYKSVDGGDTWIDLSKNPGLPVAPLGKIGITVSPANPNRLYAIVEANDGGVYRSDDAGWSWKKMNDERKLRQRAFYYSRIYADPLDPETVYCLNVNFYKSIDGGKTFDIEINVPHGDNHDLWIDPNNPQRMISSNDGGACVSTNGGKSWTDEDYPTSQLYHVTTTMDVPYHVAGAQQDNTTLSIPSDGWGFKHLNEGNKSWFYEVGGGESGYIAPHPTNPDLFYAGSQGALLTRYDRSNGQERDIQVYPRFFSGEPASSLPERWQWTYPIVFSPLDPSILYTCSQHVWKTTNDGQSWEKISPDLTFADPETLGPTGGIITKDMNGPEIYATVFALAPSFHDIQTLWAGSDDGRIHITRNGGKSWSEITPKDLPKFSTVSIIEASKHDPGTAYVAAYRYQVDDRAPYVYKTTDFGKTWIKIIKGIKPQDFARSIREDHQKRGLLFLGTENGVYVSFDAGENWESLQLNLPVTPIRDLVIKNDDVVLGTHGRSFWILDDIAPLRELNASTAAATLHFFKPADPIRGIYNLNVQYYLNEKVDSVEVSILDASGKLVQKFVGNQEVFKQDNSVPYWERDGNTKPTTAKGINTFSWNLRYAGATTFPGMIIWSGRPQVGPKAVPGKYKVSVKANGLEQSHDIDIKMDPNLKGISLEDLTKQFQLAMQIKEKESEANEAVKEIRKLKPQLENQKSGVKDSMLLKEMNAVIMALQKVEEDLYQVKNQSGQDPLNFPIKLNNRLSSLRRSVETGDARPTDASYVVFAELSKELTILLTSKLNIQNNSLKSLNEKLVKAGLKSVN
jgi:photosystem II stability/assembly factor-like uncharacterized protein